MSAPWSAATPVGTLTVTPLHLDRDAERLHAWVTHPRSAFWSMQSQDLDQVRAAYATIVADPHHDAWLVRRDGEACGLVETYDPRERELVGAWGAAPGDVGLHVLVAPPAGGQPLVHGLTSAVVAAAAGFALSRPGARRVVVEPDEGNTAVRAKNVAAGFVEHGRVDLGHKTAVLSTCTAEAFAASELGALLGWDLLGAGHLEPAAMARAHRHLVTKALSELSHERLLCPAAIVDETGAGADGAGAAGSGADAAGRTRWCVPVGPVTYTFRARVLALEHWDVDAASVTRTVDGATTDLDALVLVDELHEVLGIPDHLLGTYLEEVAATLAGAAWKDAHRRLDARALARADLQTVERSMTEGHPAFIANNGRIGFGLEDQATLTPESGAPVRLVWLAARRERSHLSCGAGVDEGSLYAGQLGEDLLARFAARLRSLRLDPADYRYLPVHPWQWEHRVAVTFAADVARRDLVPVGLGDDRYQAQQSVRTFFDLDDPERHYVKTALAIQNMGFTRGLSPAYMRATPAINDWVAGVVRGDPALRADGFDVLREVASIGWVGDVYHRAAARGTRSPQQRMVAALWRESPLGRLRPGERVMTMAALLHRDHEGRSVLGALVDGSGLDPATWWQRYLDAYLRPLVHCLLVHDLAFMPHGENVVLVLRGDVVVRVLVKDLGEEVAVFGDRPLPRDVERVRVGYDDDVRLLSVFTDVFDGVLRYAVTVLDVDGLLCADDAWRLVARCLARHREEHPDLHRRFDLFAPTFAHSCLNRLQLRNTLQMVDLSDQASSLQLAGELDNPVAAYRPASGSS